MPGDVIVMASGTDRGQLRTRNEDSVLVLPNRGLAILADGMGGHQAGDVASRMAVDVIAETLAAAPQDAPLTDEQIRQAIQKANDAIIAASEANPDYHGMGSTVVVVGVENERFVCVHLGDSRMYRIRAGEIERITRDHTLAEHYVTLGVMSAEEAQTWEGRNMLLRGLGIDGEIEPDSSDDQLRSGDILLMCSDGLTDVCDDDAIRDLVLSAEGAQHAVTQLIKAANAGGGPDNITAVVITCR